MTTIADRATEVLDVLTGPEGSIVRVECVGESTYYEGKLVDRVVWEGELHAIVLEVQNEDTGDPQRCTLYMNAVKANTLIKAADPQPAS
jgi:hypothetical protein